MLRFDHRPDRYLRAPRLVRGASAVELWVIATEPAGEAVLALGLDAGEREIARSDAILGLTREPLPRVAGDAGWADRASDGEWTVSIERGEGTSAVRARRAAVETLVWRAHGTAAAPAVHAVTGGAWVAFHHNVREDTGEPDLAKWIALRFVTDAGDVLEPSAPMTDRDRDREGEEQGFELPSLAVGPDGAVAIYGRGSHAFFRQDASAAGFTPRRALGATDWGCRGLWVSVLVADGVLHAARREKDGIVLETDPLPEGGPPALAPARVEHPARVHRDVPPRPPGPDPAARYGRRTLFGDIHQHSAHSDGCGTADEPYLRARWAYGDDFCALTDHEAFLGKRIGPGEWRYLCEVADRHDEPGAFATLLAYEWTGRRFPGPGHKVVYLPPEGGAIVGRDEVPDGAELVRRVVAQGGFAVPHHVGWTGADEAAHDPVGQPVWEICSCHGCYLHADHPLGSRGELYDQLVDAVMRRGHRFGFIACSDGHGLLHHHGVGRKRDPFRCGLTAVQAHDCTREGILRAIRERRCYATSGVPILLDLTAGGAPMGSEVRVAAPVEVRAEARAAVELASLALVGPDGVIAEVRGSGLDATVEARVGHGWVYARAEQVDGEMAWSSPIFLDPP
ncbi:MAG: CehA/McbA family metallohydrolase [Sandaracinaceae bacterium]|nr:CehA/McbA family metallohydrolase [Sandaracinaceae bacterium]